MYFPDSGCVRTLRTLYVYATAMMFTQVGILRKYFTVDYNLKASLRADPNMGDLVQREHPSIRAE